MKHTYSAIILSTLCLFAAAAQGQTIKSLGYNTTNGQVVAATNVVWTNAFNFSTNTVAAQVRTNLGLGAAKLSPTLTNITSNASVTLESSRALEVFIVSPGGWPITNSITLPTNNPQHNDLVTIFFQKSSSSIPATVTNAGGLGGPWYVYPGNEAKWIYDTNGAPARWQALGRSVRAQISYLGDNASSTRGNLGLGLAALTNNSNVTMMRALSGSTNTNHPYSGSISVTGTNNTNTLVFSNGILQEVQ